MCTPAKAGVFVESYMIRDPHTMRRTRPSMWLRMPWSTLTFAGAQSLIVVLHLHCMQSKAITMAPAPVVHDKLNGVLPQCVIQGHTLQAVGAHTCNTRSRQVCWALTQTQESTTTLGSWAQPRIDCPAD